MQVWVVCVDYDDGGLYPEGFSEPLAAFSTKAKARGFITHADRKKPAYRRYFLIKPLTLDEYGSLDAL